MRNAIIAVAALVTLACSLSASAQTTVDSNSVNVRNSAPQNVWFTFPDTTNVRSVQFGCSDSAVNADWIYVDEGLAGWKAGSNPSHQTVSCNINIKYNSQGFPVSMTGSLVGTLAVVTTDHTVTIESASWTAVYKSGRSGYYWAATGGSSQITVE